MSDVVTTSRIVAVMNDPIPVGHLADITKGLEMIYGPGLSFGRGRWTRFEVRTPGDPCWCHECEDRDAATVEGLTGDPFATISRYFIVCPDCGNKRCPRASAHYEACSGSNETGQVGSIYGPSHLDVVMAKLKADRTTQPHGTDRAPDSDRSES